MSQPFRDRTFRTVEPALRPHRRRGAARVVITDGSAVLMLLDSDPGIDGSRWWVTPGGGIDPGEDARSAAVREVAEETGLVIASGDLLGPVAVRDVVHGYSDQVLHQSETFFVLVAPRFEIDTAGHTEGEQLTLQGHDWLPIAGLTGLADPVWPENLAALIELAHTPARWPVELGRVEESTVPVVDVVLKRDSD